ncbi:large ribosomal subunit protein bL21m [Neocloeon triangulifer]|uniref:large ribosomal subunit protein bL21m n=1 Tax=Neocloeon triangulifer TaxID=2078957 RepID=UPI00286F0F71|nr:large ribosomal subunit protein bL21m [Neocloeon triangulifer]
MNFVRTIANRTNVLVPNCVEHLRTALPLTSARFLNTTSLRDRLSESPKVQEQVLRDDPHRTALDETLSKINTELASNSEGRLFAQIHVCGKQFKVTAEDLVVIEGHWPPDVGDRIKLEKVMLVGAQNFTLVGKPVLPQDLVTVEATVVEKSLSHTRTFFKMWKRHNYRRIHFHRAPLTMLRINSIKINEQLVASKATD